jgi:hypothetical protein
MRVTYSLQISATCPVDDTMDIYECSVVAERVIPAEQILAVTKEASNMKKYQEEICRFIAAQLQAEVTLLGYHSGVRTEVVCKNGDL